MAHKRPRALITGVSGQDGSYLAEWLHNRDYQVHGTVRAKSILEPSVKEKLSAVSVVELSAPHLLADIIREVRPDEIYHLAAHHFSAQSAENSADFELFLSVNLVAAQIVLELLRTELPQSRFFYAASSHIFGVPQVCPQTENTPQHPTTLYGITKSAGFHLCRYYRQKYNLHATVGVLYNHESPRRLSSFVTTQIAEAAARALVGQPRRLVIRDLDAVVDWGAAQDYVQAMWLALQQSAGNEYVIASGVPRTVRDFAQEAFGHVGLRFDEFVVQGQKQLPNDRPQYIGDSSRIRQICSWTPSTSFTDLVRSMVDAQIQRSKVTLSP